MLWRGAQHSFHKIHDAQCDSQLTSFVSHARCSCSRLGDCVRNGVKSGARRVFRVNQRWHIGASKRRKAPFLRNKAPSENTVTWPIFRGWPPRWTHLCVQKPHAGFCVGLEPTCESCKGYIVDSMVKKNILDLFDCTNLSACRRFQCFAILLQRPCGIRWEGQREQEGC